MALDGDAENQTILNEETPLLADRQSDQQLDQNENKHRQASFYIWRVLWAVTATFVCGIFIKGWIDGSDYADVGARTGSLQSFCPTDFVYSLTCKRLSSMPLVAA